jgi:hypothetical protein
MDLMWENKKYSEEYKTYLKKVGNKLRKMKEKMLKSGWTFVCIEPNFLTYNEFVNGILL